MHANLPYLLCAALGQTTRIAEFHERALAAGGSDNGPPGIRAEIHENYYAAFVIDPNGHNVEAVCHRPT